MSSINPKCTYKKEEDTIAREDLVQVLQVKLKEYYVDLEDGKVKLEAPEPAGGKK